MARILITDDEAPLRAFISAALAPFGHTFVEAARARQALHLHAELPADLVITDLVMPEMDGIEFLRRLRLSSPRVPVIAVSGHPKSKIWLNMARLVGADHILAKPFSADELIRAVEDILAAARAPLGSDDAPSADSLREAV